MRTQEEIKTQNIKDLYALLKNFEERLQKALVPKNLKASINGINNHFSSIFEKELYDI